jgi:hypothetical protein
MYDRDNWSRNAGKGKNIKKSEFSQMLFLYAFFIAMAIAFTLVVIR